MNSLILYQTGISDNYSEQFRIEETPVPEISDEEILIKIYGASINLRDIWIAQGAYSKIRLPVVLGSDGAGEIVKKGINAGNFETGDKVIIYPGDNWGSSEEFQNRYVKILGMPENGTFSDYIKVHHSKVFRYPDHLNHLQAACFPLAGLTAYRALFKKADINKSDNILITGAGGGVSTFAILFALNTGANVFVTSRSESKIEKAISLGAKGGVTYGKKDWHKELQSIAGNKIDVIIDGIGGKYYSKLIEISGYGARIISYGATLGSADKLDIHKIYWKQLKILGTTIGTVKDFKEMIEFIRANKLFPVMDSIFRLNNFQYAFERIKSSEHIGKIVFDIS